MPSRATEASLKNRYGSYDDLCELAIPTESEAEDNKHLDLQLNGERVWLTEDDFAAKYGSIGQATAVAIDLRKKADGSDFILGKNCSVAALIYMRAPGWADDSTPMETYNEVYISDREPCFSPSPSYCCREGAEGMYNIQIMEEHQTIIGMGGSATTKVVDPVTGRLRSVFNAKDLATYLRDIDVYIEKRKHLLEEIYGNASK